MQIVDDSFPSVCPLLLSDKVSHTCRRRCYSIWRLQCRCAPCAEGHRLILITCERRSVYPPTAAHLRGESNRRVVQGRHHSNSNTHRAEETKKTPETQRTFIIWFRNCRGSIRLRIKMYTEFVQTTANTENVIVIFEPLFRVCAANGGVSACI